MSIKTFKTLRNYAVTLRLVSDIFTVIIEIQPLNTGDKSLNIHQEYNINTGKNGPSKTN